jgi:hypothetical protein
MTPITVPVAQLTRVVWNHVAREAEAIAVYPGSTVYVDTYFTADIGAAVTGFSWMNCEEQELKLELTEWPRDT